MDDVAGVRDVLAGVLQDNGYAVEVAATAARAKDLLSKCQYRVVVADWRLPDGDGSVTANLAAELGGKSRVRPLGLAWRGRYKTGTIERCPVRP